MRSNGGCAKVDQTVTEVLLEHKPEMLHTLTQPDMVRQVSQHTSFHFPFSINLGNKKRPFPQMETDEQLKVRDPTERLAGCTDARNPVG